MVVTLILCVSLLLVAIYLLKKPTNNYSGKLPPSLSRLPILGNIHHLLGKKRQEKLENHEIFTEFSKTLGPIYTFWFGDRPIVFINDCFTAKKLLSSCDCSGRPQRLAGRTVSKNFQGLIVTDALQVVQKRRKIIHQALNFHEKNFLERNLQEESSELIKAIKAKQTKQKSVNDSIPMAEELSLCANNVFIRLLFNKRFPTIDGAFKTIQNLLLIMLKGLTLSNLLEGFPALRKIPLGRLMFLDEYVEGMFGFIGKEYDSHLKKKSTIDENKITDMTDILINDQNELTRDNIEVLLSDTLVAGIDASMNTLKLVVHNLAKYTDLAQTCYNEIEDVLKQNDEQKDRKITLNDVHKCHNLRAFIYESLRITTVSPLTVPHKTHTEVEVDGYIIPKDTTVFFNIHCIHQDEQVFEDPQTFNPQRFLDAKNGEFKHNDRFFGFSFGRRNCIGQSYAIKSVLFFLVELMKNFELRLPDDANLQSKFLYDTTLRVENLNVIVKER